MKVEKKILFFRSQFVFKRCSLVSLPIYNALVVILFLSFTRNILVLFMTCFRVLTMTLFFIYFRQLRFRWLSFFWQLGQPWAFHHFWHLFEGNISHSTKYSFFVRTSCSKSLILYMFWTKKDGNLSCLNFFNFCSASDRTKRRQENHSLLANVGFCLD